MPVDAGWQIVDKLGGDLVEQAQAGARQGGYSQEVFTQSQDI
jgi:hypothetical protein